MAWVNTAPNVLVPVPLTSLIIDLVPVPHAPILLLVSTKSVVVLESSSFLPLAFHNRSSECLESHGKSKEICVFQVSVNTAENERVRAATFCISTESTFLLMYQLSMNYSNSVYEITDMKNSDYVLQNSLPLLHVNANHSITNFIKSATRSLGFTAESTMTNIEHFENGGHDDETRNENIPQVRIALTKLLKLPCAVVNLWSKPNSNSVMFRNNAEQIQLLNLKSLNSHIVDFASCDCLADTLLLEYNPTYNFFFHVTSKLELSVLEVSSGETVTIKRTAVGLLDFQPKRFIFNPQHDLVLVQLPDSLYIYLFRYKWNKTYDLRRINNVINLFKPPIYKCCWAPCGEFFTVVEDNKYFKMVSKFGFTLFDSAAIGPEISNAYIDSAISSRLTDFCRVHFCTISSNGQLLFLINEQETMMYSLSLLRLSSNCNSTIPVLHDLNYLDFLTQKSASHLHRLPLLPSFQNILYKTQLINGISTESELKKSTGFFTISRNIFNQVSLAHGPNLAISTPISLGLEALHALWFQFHSHFTDSLNIVNHFWIKDILVVINRYEKDQKTSSNCSYQFVDELMILSTAASKFGAGGVDFKFDSDLITWRHTFNNRIINFELSTTSENLNMLTLLTSDLKIIIMEVSVANRDTPHKANEIKLGQARISIDVCRTIHLSSISNKFSICNVQQLVSIQERHFLFLLSTGDVFLLKNQLIGSLSNNMYELKHIGSGIERMQIFDIDFSNGEQKFVSMFAGNALFIYDLMKLIADATETLSSKLETVPNCELKQLLDPNSAEQNPDLQPDLPISSVDSLPPIIIEAVAYSPLYVSTSKTSIEIVNLEYQFIAKNEHLVIKHRTNRRLVLNRFINYDLFVAQLNISDIIKKYQNFLNYEYCLELLLYENLNEQALDKRIARICELVDASNNTHAIYVNLLRKIEVHYWPRFFSFLQQTPVEFMDRLISLKDVELCYNYLIIYLNYKRESVSAKESSNSATVLNEEERSVITQIIRMLLDARRWSACYELCRFIKLLEPLNELLMLIRQLLNV